MPLRTIEYLPVDELVPMPRNAKDHDIPAIRKSIEEFGVIEVGVIDDRTGRILSGHGRTEAYGLLAAAEQAGLEPPDGVEKREDGRWYVPMVRGWRSRDDNHAEAAAITVNKLGELGGWVDEILVEVLSDLGDVDGLLDTTGFSQDELDDLIASVASAEDPIPPDDQGDGSLLALSDVTIGEPRHQVQTGEAYRIGSHILVVEDVMTGWPVYTKHLVDDALLVPYPGPYAALSLKAQDRALVLVQPDTYLAGHLLDKYEAVRGEGSVERVAP